MRAIAHYIIMHTDAQPARDVDTYYKTPYHLKTYILVVFGE